jgi:cytoskeletal protein RodZ
MYYLHAIEVGQLEKLPGGIYTRSYLRQYAQAIDYNECDLLETCGLAVETETTAERRWTAQLSRFVRSVMVGFHTYLINGPRRSG